MLILARPKVPVFPSLGIQILRGHNCYHGKKKCDSSTFRAIFLILLGGGPKRRKHVLFGEVGNGREFITVNPVYRGDKLMMT